MTAQHKAQAFARNNKRISAPLAAYADVVPLADPSSRLGPIPASRGEGNAADGIVQFKQRLQLVLDALPDPAAIMASDGTILQVNHTWLRFGRLAGVAGVEVGENHLDEVLTFARGWGRGAELLELELAELCAGQRSQVSYIVDGMGLIAGREFRLVFSALGGEPLRRIMVCAQEVTELQQLKIQHERLVGQILHAQDEERRRIARELHDSTAQLIVGLSFNLVQLERVAELGPALPFLSDCFEAVEDLQREVRALSYLYHPPQLDGGGLKTGLHRLITGAAKRSGLAVETFLDDVAGASPVVENALYRVAQEALTNIHRHARATHVRATLTMRRDRIHLKFEDDGIGMTPTEGAPPPQLGVGIAGMRERLRELGGRLSIPRTCQGTVIIASLPRTTR